MNRSLSFFKLAYNGTKWYVTCAEYGPFTSVDEAMDAAVRANLALKRQRQQSNNEAIEAFKRLRSSRSSM